MIPHEDAYRRINPIVTVFENFTGYKNKRNGAIYENVGHIISKGFKVADNFLAGIEYSLMNFALPEGVAAHIDDALVIGRSENWLPVDNTQGYTEVCG